MKKTYSLFSFLFLLMVLACNKSTDLYEEVGKGAYLTLVPKGSGTGKNLNAINPSSAVTLKVASYGEPVESVNVYVSSANTTDTTKWKLIKNVPLNGETDLSVTHAQIATALGLTPGNLAPGTTFHLWNQAILKDGRRFGSYNTNSPDLESQLEFNVAFHWTATVVCAFSDTAPFDNKVWLIVKDEWADFAVGDPVTVKLGPGANQITLVDLWPTSVQHKDMVINIDPTSGAATVPRYTYGAYGGGTVYTNATTGTSNYVFSCTKTIELTMNHQSTSGTNYGNFKLALKPQ